MRKQNMNKKQEAEMIRQTMSLLGSRKSAAKTRAARLNAKKPRKSRLSLKSKQQKKAT
jgi:hypothetical protein